MSDAAIEAAIARLRAAMADVADGDVNVKGKTSEKLGCQNVRVPSSATTPAKPSAGPTTLKAPSRQPHSVCAHISETDDPRGSSAPPESALAPTKVENPPTDRNAKIRTTQAPPLEKK